MVEYKLFEVGEERLDVYRKLKDGFDFLASIMCDEKKSVVHRIRAVKVMSETANTMRLYMLDEEKLDELEKDIKEIKKEYDERYSGNKR